MMFEIMSYVHGKVGLRPSLQQKPAHFPLSRHARDQERRKIDLVEQMQRSERAK